MIIEICYRWFLADRSERGSPCALVFVADLQGGDAPQELLKALDAPGREVLPASRAMEGRDGTIDSETGRRGTILRVRSIEHHPVHIEVHFEATSGMDGREGATLILVWDATAWRVKEARHRWIT